MQPDLEIVTMRGNIHTRLEKLYKENLDGVVLAAAGLYRVGLKDKITRLFGVEEIVPAPAQGILCAGFRTEDKVIKGILLKLCDDETVICANLERMLLAAIKGGCHVPFGAYCELLNGEFKLHAVYGDREGKSIIRDSMTEKTGCAPDIITMFARKLINAVDGR